jgi:lipopolysaccharide/colanic/teichoic acid biosynthesis glycosyltransferase
VKKRDLAAKAAALGVSSPEQFQALLKYERARSDRVGTTFSVVSLGLHTLADEERELRNLVQALGRRMRTTDVLGMLDERTLAVLLPGTGTEGGVSFAADFSSRRYGEQAHFPFTVYCHPEHWFGGGDGVDGRDRSRDNRFGRTEWKVAGTLTRRLPVWKRALDIGGALVGLALSSPVFLVLGGYIKMVSPGPVLFKQNRLGFRAVPFTFLKFRTMHPDNDPCHHQAHLKELITKDGPMEKLDMSSDPRIIPGGRVLRKTCVDEIPQLINVLRGEMSLVGPRPCLPYEAQDYLRWHGQRFDVLPGLTGLWQVSGKNNLTFKQMIRLDIRYCRNMSLWLDLAILFRTVPTILGLVFDGIANRLAGAARRRQGGGLRQAVSPED